MKKLIVYDSVYGNTHKIAQAIAKSLSATAVNITEIKNSDLINLELLVIGSPTHGGRASEKIQKFISDLSKTDIKNTKLAVFDTRFLEKDLKFSLKLLVKTIGYASPKMANVLTKKGGKLIVQPEGFIVKGKEGPLANGELERAGKWIKL